ncbi:MAG: biotin-dependent carboxyltransferase family protein [Candidatus Symbiobacter sp.]|nr:biotin-dependent carboxyltransferase family protein [Candidatus Symbiobacter sp.]
MGINILEPGLSTTVQDLGRPGYYHIGIPLSGSMDRYSHHAGNLLVGNDVNAALLEFTFMGPKLEFTRDTVIALTGASMSILVNEVEHDGWQAIPVKAGDVVSFGFLIDGARAYLAIAGGIDVPVVLGSRSTYTLGALGGHQGRKLEAGDSLPLGPPQGGKVRLGKILRPDLRQELPKNVKLRLVTGLYWHRITATSGQKFLADHWKVAPEADRIGYRFRSGRKLEFVPRDPPFGAGSDPSNIVDGCYPYGSVQVPGGTEPIVLHRDAVSGGGYFMLGTVISADMDAIGQLQPHMTARFEAVSLDQALAARYDYFARLDALRGYLA